MIRISLLVLTGLLMSFLAGAQENKYPVLRLSQQGTSTVIFPAAIKEIDLGSRQIVSKRVPDKLNWIWLKAIAELVPSTNITIITSDDRLYVLQVESSATPESWVLTLDTANAIREPSTNAGDKSIDTDRIVSQKANNAAIAKVSILKRNYNGITAYLRHWENRGSDYFFQWEFINRAAVPFELGGVQCWIITKNGKRRSARQSMPVQIRELDPGNFTIPSGKKQVVLVTLPCFWLNRSQHAVLVWLDKKGERSIRVKINPRHQRKISKEQDQTN